jgi:drug/metabolite transporter (DMT)-like permease/nitroimidazol reductase NimA-like FMN-containing flavoprotein (pyridoxamine 5'-phosphate oxidase superfamily)
MSLNSSATARDPVALSPASASAWAPAPAPGPGHAERERAARGQERRADRAGLAWAALGVLAFSLTFPATSLALRSFDPYVVGVGRSVGAAAIAGVCLLAARAPFPSRAAWPGLLAVAAGCGIGFGLLSALALRHTTSTHAAIVVGLLPAATAVVAVLRAGERPGWAFWAASLAASATIAGYSVSVGGGRIVGADALLLAALAIGAVGYAEGGRLSRAMPGWQVIAWGVLLALPVSLPVTAVAAARSGVAALHPSAAALGGLAYVSAVSMFAGFAAWYRGLGRSGVARASQLQLAQPLLTVAWSALLLGEHAGPGALGVAAVVIVCVLVTQRARIVAAAAGPAESAEPAAESAAGPAESAAAEAAAAGSAEPAAAPPAGPAAPATVPAPGASARTRVHRHSDRALHDRAALHAVLDAGLVAHVGFVAGGSPVVLPMGYARDGERLLLHGSSRNRLLREAAAGAELCVTVTHLDGLVLAATAFSHSMNYRSAVVHGRGREVADPTEKARALARFVDFAVPGRSAQLRPSTGKELAATLVVELSLAEASVKARRGGPQPEPAAGAEPAAWTGVIPLALERGEPAAY